MTNTCQDCGGPLDWTLIDLIKLRRLLAPVRCKRCVLVALDAGFIEAGEEPILTPWRTVRGSSSEGEEGQK